MAAKIDDLLAESENLLHELNVERLKMAEEVLSSILESARKESEALRLQSTQSRGTHASTVVLELLSQYSKIAPIPSPEILPDLRQSCDHVLEEGSRFLERAEGRELSDAARVNMERLRHKLDGVKKRVDVWDTEIIPLAINLNALFEQFGETEVFQEGSRMLKLWRDTELQRKQKRTMERQKRRK